MATRVTPTEVKVIVSTTLADPVIQVWIDAANAIVNVKADCIGGDNALLTQVELQLSAHFVAMLQPKLRGFVTSQGLDVLKETYSNPSKLSELIDSTVYGQAANMISNGCLADISDKIATVGFF